MERVCKHCNNTISVESGRSFSNHVRWCDSNPKIAEYRSNKKISDKKKEFYNKSRKVYKLTCPTCNSSFDLKIRAETYNQDSAYYCTISCSKSRKNSTRWLDSRQDPQFKKKISEASIRNHANGVYDSVITGIKFSSKNERAIVEFIKTSYPFDGWKSGGHLKLKDKIFLSRDLWSDKKKICFEYDDIWHFKDIKGQLKAKQEKDKLLEQWCIANHYKLIRVDEAAFTTVEDVADLIYNSTAPITKIGNRY